MHPLFRLVLCALAAASVSTAALAQYPDKPLRLVVPYAPGGMGSIFGTIMNEHLSKALGQQVVPDYRPGANGSIGAAQVASSRPDGYTLLMAVNSMMAINPHLYPKLAYDPVKDFAPVSLIWTSANVVLVVHPSNPANSVQELIAQAKGSPGKLSYASSGNGTTVHLSGEMFKRLAGIDLVHIPYKGNGPATTDLIGNQVTLLFSDTSALSHVAGHRLKALAVTSAKRLSAVPALPTMKEAGLPAFEITSWYSVVAPAGTPKPVIDRLSTAVKQAMSTPEVQAKLRDFGADVAEDFSPEYLAALIRSDLAKYKTFIAAAGIKVD